MTSNWWHRDWVRVGPATTASLALIMAALIAAPPALGQATDEPAGASLKIRKVDQDNTRLPGAVFIVEGIDRTFVTDASGEFCLTGLPFDAEYWVIELEAPEGYQKADPDRQLVEVDDDGDCDSPDAVFVNARAEQTQQPTATPEQTVSPATGTPEQTVQPATGTPEQTVAAGTGTPGHGALPDTGVGSGGLWAGLTPIVFAVILLTSLGALVTVNVSTARRR